MNCVKRIALMVIRNILLVPFIWCKLCYYAAHVDKYPEITRYKLLKYIVKRANKGGNVTIEAYGKENIPKEGGFMFFPNHQGLYDVLAIVDACPRPLSVVAKKEVASAAIYQNGILIKIISTDHEETFRIEDGENWNEITVDKDGIHVSGASCPDKICMHTVWRGKGSLPIVCLPNHLVITAAPEETDDEFDVLTY